MGKYKTVLVNKVNSLSPLLSAFLSLLPAFALIFSPISGDLSIYLSGAKSIIDGNVLYVDFIDLKQPFFYLLYTPIQLISSGNAVIVHLFEVLLLLLTSFLLIKVLNKVFNSNSLSIIAAFSYNLIYSFSGYTNTFHTEVWFNLFFALILYYFYYWDKNNIIYLGIILGLILSIKISFIIIVPFVFVLSPFKEKPLVKFIKIICLALSVAFVANIPLLLFGNFTNYLEVLRYLQFYSGLPEINSESMKSSVESIRQFFANYYGLAFFGFTFYGTVLLILNFNNYEKKQKEFILLSGISFLLLFISIAIERKFSPMHFMRLLLVLSIINSYGIMSFLNNFRMESLSKNKAVKFIISSVIILFIIVFTPLINSPKYLQSAIYKITSPEKYSMLYTKDNNSVVLEGVYENLAEYFSNIHIIY